MKMSKASCFFDMIAAKVDLPLLTMKHGTKISFNSRMAWLLQSAIALTFMVILAGSVVRATGSGMGCPDWPKCFGLLIPPTDVEQVTWHANSDYSQGQMIVRDEALWQANLDFTTAESWDKSQWTVYTRHDYAIFNPVHTWIEYINRLFGALLGLPMLIATGMAFTVMRSRPRLLGGMMLAMFFLGFEAWLGKLLVDGHLIPQQITLHMVGAFALLAVLVNVLRSVKPMGQHSDQSKLRVKVKRWAIAVIVLLAVQVVLGTQVREQIDVLLKTFGVHDSRLAWMGQLDITVLVHRSFSWMLLIASWYLHRAYKAWQPSSPLTLMLLIGFVLIAVLGAMMYYLSIPAVIQPAHLLLTAVTWMIGVDVLVRSWQSTN